MPTCQTRQRHNLQSHIIWIFTEWNLKSFIRAQVNYRSRRWQLSVIILFAFNQCLWAWNLVCHVKERMYLEPVWEQGAEGNFWTWEGWDNRKREKTTYLRASELVLLAKLYLNDEKGQNEMGGSWMRYMRGVQKRVLVWKHEGKRKVGKTRGKWGIILKWNSKVKLQSP